LIKIPKKDSNVAFLATHPQGVKSFLLPHFFTLRKLINIDVYTNLLLANALPEEEKAYTLKHITIQRRISPIRDLIVIWKLYQTFKKNKYDVVHTITPKAGLLGIFAAWLAGVPIRIHIFTGQVWANKRGFLRYLLKTTDKFIAFLATNILVDSFSQEEFLIENKILQKNESNVLGNGSVSGVNLMRFFPSKKNQIRIRKGLSTPMNSIVCLYLGRINKDKGVFDLANAFKKVAKNNPSFELWFIGPDEENTYVKVKSILNEFSSQVKRKEFTTNPEDYMQAADFLCLPSYREGFGSVVIEAAACQIPSLVSRIYGLKDSIKDNKSGLTFEVGNVDDLARMLEFMYKNPEHLKKMGKNAIDNVKNCFSEKILTHEMEKYYQNLLEALRCPK